MDTFVETRGGFKVRSFAHEQKKRPDFIYMVMVAPLPVNYPTFWSDEIQQTFGRKASFLSSACRFLLKVFAVSLKISRI